MEHAQVERRRSPRVPVTSGAIVMRPVSMAVRLLDLSSDGVQLASPDPMRLGARRRVVARLAGRPLDVEFEVRHVSTKPDQNSGGYRVGGQFRSIDALARLVIDDLLSGRKV
jgi:hypothetical protein